MPRCKIGAALHPFGGYTAEKQRAYLAAWDATDRRTKTVYTLRDAQTHLTGLVIQTARGFGAFLRDDDVQQYVGHATFYPDKDRAIQAVRAFFPETRA